jgi:peroxiredoxin
MRLFYATIAVLVLSFLAFGQNEQAPIVEKKIDYEDWVLPNVLTGKEMNLRKFVRGNKLVMVVYWAPWCPNWKHDAAFVQGLYEKYKGDGFDVIGIAEYDSVAKMKSHIEQYKLTFPSVYESDSTAAREKTKHFTMRRAAGDTRKWGSPWYVFFDGTKPEPTGPIQTETAAIVNGELIKKDAEEYIRKKLGLSDAAAK